MPIVATDIKIVRSHQEVGGIFDLGGTLAPNNLIPNNTMYNLFDRITGSESNTGDTEYRCLFVFNDHPTLTLLDATLQITVQTPSADTTAGVAADTQISNTVQTIPDESTPPVQHGTSNPLDYEYGVDVKISIGSLAPSQGRAVWFKRDVSPEAGASTNDFVTFRVEGATLA